MGRRAIGIALLGFAAFAALAAPASAGSGAKTTVTISDAGFPKFTGQIAGKKPECVSHRRVALQSYFEGEWGAFDSILTKSSGRYFMRTTETTPTDYRVIVKAKVIDGVSCGRGTSAVIHH